MLPQIINFERQAFELAEFFRRAKIELPASLRQEQILRSARTQFEKQLIHSVSRKLSAESGEKLLQLLEIPSPTAAHAKPAVIENGLTRLQTEIGNPNVSPVCAEIEKLELLRAIRLPVDLFGAVSPKIVENLRRRLAVEDLHEICRHPLELKLTLLAAFVHTRQFEVTDNLVVLLLYLIHKNSSSSRKEGGAGNHQGN